ncbi:replication factor A protein 1-like [Lotus japonicus]|uniref:replication factor A protein 1-like n=1 Tax=Lotus japonicus TaxID=34305 RepID=UPI0025900ACF|nr:replication factor A protein 1-like [Lotus japonicus]
MDMILMDDKGCKIHATVRKTLIYRFQSSLTEGKVYQISYFGVGESGRDFRPTDHPFKINFDIQTSVRLLPNKAINITPYSFVPLADIMYKDLDTSFLIDVIGILTGASGEQDFQKDGTKQKRITIELDQDGVRVECAFFGKYVSEVIAYLSSVDATNAVVVVQCCKIKPFKGKNSIQNVYGATRVLFNPQIQEAAPLRARFLESNDPAAHIISLLQDSSKKISLEEDFLKKSDGKTIELLKDLAEKSFCVVLGTVKYIAEGMVWHYPACKCSKKVYPADGMYFCDTCNRHVVSPTHKFRIQLRVMDSKDTATFALFDQEASALLNKSCSDLLETYGSDPLTIPTEILNLIDKTYLFKIEVANNYHSKFEKSYRVKKICADPEVINNFRAAMTFQPVISCHDPCIF